MAGTLASTLLVATAAPSPMPWTLEMVYQDSACSTPWAPRTQRWYRSDACGSIAADGGSFLRTANATHAHQRVFRDTQCESMVGETWFELGACNYGAGTYSVATPAAAPKPLADTVVHTFTNSANCTGAPMVVETYPANQCYLPDPLVFSHYQDAVCDGSRGTVTILAQCNGKTCAPRGCGVTTIKLGSCPYPHTQYSCE